MITESQILNRDRQILRSGQKIDQSLLWMVVLMVSFGLLMIYSATVDNVQAPLAYLQKQLIYVGGIGLFLLLLFRVQMKTWLRCTPWMLFGSLFLLGLVLGIGREINGAVRWIDLKIMNVQPAEIFKIVLIMYLASLFTRKADMVRNIKKMIPPGLLIGAAMWLIMLQPDMGSTVVIAAVALGMMFLAGLPWKWFGTMVLAGVGMMAVLTIIEPYRMLRVLSFHNPFADPYGSGYQMVQALTSIARGGWTGLGLGGGMAKLSYLPEGHTDFIFITIGEEFGFVGLLLLVFCYGWLVWRSFTIGRQARDLELFYGAFVAKGIGLWLGLQSFVNLGVNIGLLPTKGLPLPLFSYGGSSIGVALFCIMLLLRIDYENRQKMRGYKVEG